MDHIFQDTINILYMLVAVIVYSLSHALKPGQLKDQFLFLLEYRILSKKHSQTDLKSHFSQGLGQ